MPVETTENEIRVRVENPDRFSRFFQLWPAEAQRPELEDSGDWPYNKEGIRAIGGPLKSDPKKIIAQSIRFSLKEKYGWTEAKAEAWVRDHGMTPKGSSVPVPDILARLEFAIVVVKSPDQLPAAERLEGDGQHETIYVEGYASTGDLDRDEEVIDQETLTFEDYLKNPIVLLGHNPDWPIGKTMDIKKDGGLWVRVAVIGATPKGKEAITLIRTGILKAFSVGGRFKWRRQECDREGCREILMGFSLFEISIVPVQSNPSTIFQLAKAIFPRLILSKSIMPKSLPVAKSTPAGLLESWGIIDHAPIVEKKKDVKEMSGTEQPPADGGAEKQEPSMEPVLTALAEINGKMDQVIQMLEGTPAPAEEDATPDEEKGEKQVAVEKKSRKGVIVQPETEKGTGGKGQKLTKDQRKELAAKIHAEMYPKG